jgi:hypothetical protein
MVNGFKVFMSFSSGSSHPQFWHDQLVAACSHILGRGGNILQVKLSKTEYVRTPNTIHYNLIFQRLIR